MTWETLAIALRGVLDFYDNYGAMLLSARIEQEGVYVGDVDVKMGYPVGGEKPAAEGTDVTETA